MDGSSKKIKKDNQSTKKQPTKANKSQKRPQKRAKDQNDIRTLIKKKKNELVSYSKDFEFVCKQSGIDVDPEQLQLAIALSKSLQDSETVKNDEVTIPKNLTANQRKGKIRTTLQEYGFKVPEIKTNIAKKAKKHRKNYKLLTVSDSEKQQKIADKYAQLLFTNVGVTSITEDSLFKVDNCNSLLYNLSTNVTYDCIKNDDIFYVTDLIQKNNNARHHMLKDWSEIPGRPASPKIYAPHLSFKSIDCSQEDLAHILSGTIEAAQNIVNKNYHNNWINKVTTETVLEFQTQDVTESELSKDHLTEMNLDKSPSKCNFVDLTSCKDIHNMTSPRNRSYSPDIFDDEVTIIMESPKDVVPVPEEVLERTMVREQNDFMDLTECVNILNCNNTNNKQNSCLSQGTNKTTINPNDFMELTACVTASSQKILNDMEITEHNEKENKNPNKHEDNCNTETMNLTQSSNNSLPAGEKNDSVNKSLGDDTIIMIDEDYCNINADGNPVTLAPKENEIIDLVSGQYNKTKILNNDPDAVISLVQSPISNVNEPETSNLEYNQQLHDADRGDSQANKESNELECNKQPDTIDLTQALNLKDDSPYMQMSGCSKTSSVDIISNHEVEEDNGVQGLSEDKVNSPEGLNCSYDNASNIELGLAKHKDNKNTPGSPGFEDYDNGYVFDDPIYDIPISPCRYSDNSEREHDNLSGQNKNQEAINLTQSSNSEDSIQVVRKDGDDITGENPHPNNGTLMDRSQDTIILNEDDYCSSNLIHNNLGRSDDICCVEVRKASPEKSRLCIGDLYEKSKYAQSKGKQQMISDFDNDLEFDNLLENVSKSKENTTRSSKSDTDKDLQYDSYLNCGDEVENPSCEIDLTQHSDNFGDKMSNLRSSEISDDLGNEHNKIPCDGPDREIDLTQHSNCSEDINYRSINELGKINNVSIDYDEIYIESNSKDCNNIYEIPTFDNNEEKENCSKEDHPSSSQNSEIFEISDNEFNYSVHQQKQDNESIRNQSGFDIGGMSVIDEFLNRQSLNNTKEKLRCSCANLESNANDIRDQSCLPEVALEYNDNNIYNDDNLLHANENRTKSCTEIESVKISTPTKSKSCDNVLFAKTPTHNNYILKTDQVTPMPKYEMMSSPERNEELDKFGIKPLKRKRAIQILTHIYNQTHPVMEIVPDPEAYSSPSKIRKRNDVASFPRRAIVSQIDSVMAKDIEVPGTSSQYLEPTVSQPSSKSRKGSKKSKTSPIKSSVSPEYSKHTSKENIDIYAETKEVPDIRDIECCSEEWVFQKREKAKVHSCRVPLHVAFHNYVSCRRGLREAILRYEPINIDDIHKGLVAIGYRYNPKDLLKFMDKKCITVKTADNARNNKK